MKKTIAVLLAAAGLPAAALAATVTVLVTETAVRKKPQFFAPSAGTARLGQTFEAEGPDGGWYKVDGRLDGYIHASAVTAKKVKVGSDAVAGGGATAEEVTLAGKGFNAQVEKAYGAKNGSADFSAVNAMERREVSESAVLEFMRAGGLLPEGGAR
ncbi:MAG: hypothetical protein SF051_03410 [Elusimicrobiota bacterium]|nr:hypothetical protein [Elusimicrobiota bacterium]